MGMGVDLIGVEVEDIGVEEDVIRAWGMKLGGADGIGEEGFGGMEGRVWAIA